MQKALVVVAERLERGVARARVAHLLRARREAVPSLGDVDLVRAERTWRRLWRYRRRG
jgi:hypothetical protein